MAMMQLCDAKNCWLYELDHVPANELPYWAAYYEDLARKQKRAEAQASARARR